MFEARTEVRSVKQRGVSDERLATILTEIRRKLTEGLSSAAEKNYYHDARQFLAQPEHLSTDLKRSASPIASFAENGNVRPITSKLDFIQFDI